MFNEVSGDKTPVLLRKLKLCSVVFDFSEGSGLENEKEVLTRRCIVANPHIFSSHSTTGEAPALAGPYRIH